jgi:CYTH domain
VPSTLTEGRRPISTEFELKLAAPAAKLEKLKRALQAMLTVKSEVRSKLVSTDYDTPALALHRERLSFRVRKQGPEFVQAIKAENPAQGDVLERKEWEDQIPSRWPVLDASRTGKRLPDAVRDEELRPVFTTMVTRTVIEISPESSARMCICFLPFPTEVLARFLDDPYNRETAATFYAIGLVLPAAVWTLAWIYASHSYRLIDRHLSSELYTSCPLSISPRSPSMPWPCCCR